jgi:hypothetical protein
MDPKPPALFDPGDEKITYHEQLHDRFIIAAIIVFLLDLLIRRVRLFDRKFLKRRRRSHSAGPPSSRAYGHGPPSSRQGSQAPPPA